jgi:hypothetical protein
VKEPQGTLKIIIFCMNSVKRSEVASPFIGLLLLKMVHMNLTGNDDTSLICVIQPSLVCFKTVFVFKVGDSPSKIQKRG